MEATECDGFGSRCKRAADLRGLSANVPSLLLAGLVLVPGSLWGGIWIQQDRWMFLGPMENMEGCAGDLLNNPTPGHDLARECPGVGEDWGGGAIPFVPGARTRWTELAALGLAPGDVVDFEGL